MLAKSAYVHGLKAAHEIFLRWPDATMCIKAFAEHGSDMRNVHFNEQTSGLSLGAPQPGDRMLRLTSACCLCEPADPSSATATSVVALKHGCSQKTKDRRL